jgi:hypothetical protein
MIRVLSLWQPWATLIAIGAKRFETRSWSTAYRGPIAIHAAKTWTPEQRAMVNTDPCRAVLLAAKASRARYTVQPPTTWIYSADHRYRAGLPHGVIVAVAELVDIYPTADPRYAHEIEAHGAQHEQAFGDYRAGRFAWRFEQVRALLTPVPCVGHQGLFTPTAAELAALQVEIARLG